MRKADVISFLILLLEKSKIATTIDILRYLGDHLGLADIAKDKVVSIKRNFVTVRNVTNAIYRKYDEKNLLYKYFWLEPIAGFFYLQMNIFCFFYTIYWGKPSDKYSL